MANLRDHDAYMYGWNLWRRGKPRPVADMNRKGWDAAKRAAGVIDNVPLTEYAAAFPVDRLIYEDDGDVLGAKTRR